MRSILVLLLCCTPMARAVDITNAVASVTNAIGQIFFNTFTTNCTDLQKLVGIHVNQLNQSTPDLSRVTLNLCTANRTAIYNLSNGANLVLADPDFNRNLSITIYLHGYLDDRNSASVNTLRRNLITRGNTNVLFIDSSSLISAFYLWASTYIPFIGQLLGTQLAALVNEGVNPSKIHLIGHSLGAHMSGFAGKTFQALTGAKLGRISGLDPAGPCFFIYTSNHTLTPTDANFVDVIHTNAGVNGFIKPLGHVDFYPNGGTEQPGALFPEKSHIRSWQLYAESLLYDRNFLAVKCSDWTSFLSGRCAKNERAAMGIATPLVTRGSFYLKTGGVHLYGMGLNGTIGNPVVNHSIYAFIAWWKSLVGIK